MRVSSKMPAGKDWVWVAASLAAFIVGFTWGFVR